MSSIGSLRGRAGSPFWLLATWLALDASVVTYLQVYGVNAVSTALLVVAAGAFALAVARSSLVGQSVLGLLVVLAGIELLMRVLLPFRAGGPAPVPLFQGLAFVAGIVFVGGILAVRRASTDRPLAVCLLGVVVLGVICRAATVSLDIDPSFDVPLIQEAAGNALRTGGDPYLTRVYDSGYPYLPVAAIGAAFGTLFGDARWAIVAGDVMTLAGILLLARRLELPGALGAAVAAMWAWWSGGLYMVWQGFPEPILIGFLTLGAALLVGPRPRAVPAGILIGLSMATKQFAVAVVPFLLLSRPGRRAALIAVLTAIAMVLPFALWHTPEFLDGTVWSLLDEPGRDYALNLLVWPSGRLNPPYVPILVAALGAGWLVARRFGRVSVDAEWLAGSTTLLLMAFLLNRIAFVNYYAIPMLMLLLLVLVLASRQDHARGRPANG